MNPKTWHHCYKTLLCLAVALTLAAAATLLTTPVAASLPQYTFDQVTSNTTFEQDPIINATGQMIWRTMSYSWSGYRSNVIYYNGQQAAQIGSTDMYSVPIDINDNGACAWSGLYNVNYYQGSNTQVFNAWGDDLSLNNNSQVAWISSYNLYLYSGGSTQQIATDCYDAVMNNQGKIVWWGSDGNDYEIFLYDGQTVTQVTNNNVADLYPYINDAGEIAWLQKDYQNYTATFFLADSQGQHSISTPYGIDSASSVKLNNQGQAVWYANAEIYFYDGATATRVTQNDYLDFWPTLNNQGQIAWLGKVGNADYEIFTYKDGQTRQLTDNTSGDGIDYNGTAVGVSINDQGVIVWGAQGEIMRATPQAPQFAKYDFTFSYEEGGDHYSGWVYAPTGYYQAGADVPQNVEGDRQAFYHITLETPGDFGALAGNVYVASYYDKQTHYTFTPIGHPEAVGTNFLGTEHNWIITGGEDRFQFGLNPTGGTFYEADGLFYFTSTVTLGDGSVFQGVGCVMPQYSIYVGNEVGNPQNSYVGIFGLLSHTEEQDMFVYIYQFSNGRQYIGVGAQNHTDSSGISLCWLSNAPDNRIISWYNLGEGETYTYNTFVTATGELFTGTADYLNNCGFTGHPATNPQTLLSGQYALMNVNQVPGFFNNFWSLVYGGNLLESEY